MDWLAIHDVLDTPAHSLLMVLSSLASCALPHRFPQLLGALPMVLLLRLRIK